MYHKDLHLLYPESPYLQDFNDLVEFFKLQETRTTEEEFFNEIYKHIKDEKRETLKIFLKEIISENTIFYLSKQKIENYYTKDLRICFHPFCYLNDNQDGLLDKEYLTEIKWNILSLHNYVQPLAMEDKKTNLIKKLSERPNFKNKNTLRQGYIHDGLEIHKNGKILIFGPTTYGRITLTDITGDQKFCFVSVGIHQNQNILTLSLINY